VTNYIDRTAEGKDRVNIYGRPITNDAIPKFIIEREPVATESSKRLKWHKPKGAHFRYPSKIGGVNDQLHWRRAFRLDPGGGNIGEISPTDRTVGCAIIDHLNNKTGQCDPAYDLLAVELGFSRSTIERSVKRLVHRGWFHASRRPNRTSQLTPTYPAEILAMLRDHHSYDVTMDSGNVKSGTGSVTAMTCPETSPGDVLTVLDELSNIEPRGHDPVYQDASKLSGEKLRELDARLRIAERQKRLQGEQPLKNLSASVLGEAHGPGNKGASLQGPASLAERREFAAPKTGGRTANGPSTICRTWRYQSKLFEQARTACVDLDAAFDQFDKKHVAEVHSENEWDGMWKDFLLEYAGRSNNAK